MHDLHNVMGRSHNTRHVSRLYALHMDNSSAYLFWLSGAARFFLDLSSNEAEKFSVEVRGFLTSRSYGSQCVYQLLHFDDHQVPGSFGLQF